MQCEPPLLAQTPAQPPSRCFMFQRQIDPASKRPLIRSEVEIEPIAETAIAHFYLPLGVYLLSGIRLEIKNKPVATAQFDFCDERGCHALVPLGEKLLAQLKAESLLTVSFEDLDKRSQKRQLSLRGFTKGWKSMTNLNQLNKVTERVNDKKPVATPDISAGRTTETLNVNKAKTGNLPYGRRWIMNKKPSNYTLQLIDTKKENKASSFIRRHGLGAAASYYQTQRESGTTFVVTYGDYESLRLARNALKELPAAVRSKKPWPRTFSALRANFREVTQSP